MSKTDFAEVALKVLSVYFFGSGAASFVPYLAMWMSTETRTRGLYSISMLLGPAVQVVLGISIWAASRSLARVIAPESTDR